MASHTRLQAILRKSPALKAKEIASVLRVDRAEVNRLLYLHSDLFSKDTEFRWSLVRESDLRIELGEHRWLTAANFEDALIASGSPLDSACSTVTFVVAKDCSILLEALARLLALCNQLSSAGKRVLLDFSDCQQTLSYLDRVGFFDHLLIKIEVLPHRPTRSKAADYSGNNDGVVEFREISPSAPNQDIPRLLGNSFVRSAGEKYSVAALTVLGELFSNVVEHSAAASKGFAGLQFYKRSNQIQTVISDSGVGIVGTLEPILQSKYPELAKKIAVSSLDPRVALLREVFSSGGISRVNDEARGLGLKRSGEFAKKFKAKISVRQDRFELTVFQHPDRVEFSYRLNLAKLSGTHICFNFPLD